MTLSIRNCSELKHSGAGQWGRVFGNLFPTLSQALSRPGAKVDCPVTGHRLGFQLNRLFNENGVAYSYGEGKLDPVALAQFLGNMNCAEAFRSLRDEIDGCPLSRPLDVVSRNAKASPKKKDLRPILRRMWKEALPIGLSTPLALKYFALRGIPVDVCMLKTLRFHPKALYRDDRTGEKSYMPAILSLMVHNDEPCGLHRIYLDHDGRKASVDEPKKSLYVGGLSREQIDASVMPIARTDSKVAFVTEGVEKALAILAVNQDHNIDAAGAAWYLENYQPSDRTEHVVVFEDKELSGVGHAAAVRLQKRMLAGGRRCDIVEPPVPIPEGHSKVDWDWILLNRGPQLIDQCIQQIPSLNCYPSQKRSV